MRSTWAHALSPRFQMLTACFVHLQFFRVVFNFSFPWTIRRDLGCVSDASLMYIQHNCGVEGRRTLKLPTPEFHRPCLANMQNLQGCRMGSAKSPCCCQRI